MPTTRACCGRDTPLVQSLSDPVRRRDALLLQLSDDWLQLGRSRQGSCCKGGSALGDDLRSEGHCCSPVAPPIQAVAERIKAFGKPPSSLSHGPQARPWKLVSKTRVIETV